eukprot:gnl/Chilomastix_cuspidata/4028.p1 GENE.gnl/Chilomastix_cuspidata/4028~~gnl/Chilomastix_cuspidata/4028.p1  ORF type:complete len:207 (+),score=45.69 gnl/Chilomastix_cuspidata/4028:274-894(+)
MAPPLQLTRSAARWLRSFSSFSELDITARDGKFCTPSSEAAEKFLLGIYFWEVLGPLIKKLDYPSKSELSLEQEATPMSFLANWKRIKVHCDAVGLKTNPTWYEAAFRGKVEAIKKLYKSLRVTFAEDAAPPTRGDGARRTHREGRRGGQGGKKKKKKKRRRRRSPGTVTTSPLTASSKPGWAQPWLLASQPSARHLLRNHGTSLR